MVLTNLIMDHLWFCVPVSSGNLPITSGIYWGLIPTGYILEQSDI